MKVIIRQSLFMGAVVVYILWALAGWPVRAQAGLPPRPTLTPAPAPSSTPTPAPARPGEVGAHIMLQAVGAPSQAWSVVQWQGSDGVWHDVEGWQGELNWGSQRWWVAAKDFGAGPFRWLVTEGRGGPLWGVSQPFTLPTDSGATLPVAVSASP